MATSSIPFSEYSLRNRDHILKVIKKYIFTNEKAQGNVLAIAEGSGAHSACFAEFYKNMTFQPSEYEEQQLKILNDNLKGWSNINSAIQVDSSQPEKWNLSSKSFDMITCFNMIHISPWECTIGLLKGATKYLKPDGWLITYGPYAIDGKLEPESNVKFDESLKSRNELWGIRDMVEIEKHALKQGLILKHKVKMPANNYCLLFQKKKEEEDDSSKM